MESLSMEWLSKELEKLKYSPEPAEEILEFERNLSKIMTLKLKCSQWKLSDFLTLATAFHFLPELKAFCKIFPSNDTNGQATEDGYTNRISTCDIEGVIKKTKICYQEKLTLFQTAASDKGISDLVAPIIWLELCEAAEKSNLSKHRELHVDAVRNIPKLRAGINPAMMTLLEVPELSKLIRYKFFGLSVEEKEKLNSQFPRVYKLNELAKRWGTNEENVLAACIESNIFWAYIKSTNDLRSSKDVISLPASLIEKDIKNGKLQADYKYPYKGYARLAKNSEHSCQLTLSSFHVSGDVKYEEEGYAQILIEPPFCEVILGNHQFVEVKHDIKPELFFIAEEIQQFEQTEDFTKKFPHSCTLPPSDKSIAVVIQALNNQCQRKKNRTKGAEKAKEDAEKRAAPYLECALIIVERKKKPEPIMEGEKKLDLWSASELAKQTIIECRKQPYKGKINRDTITERTLRGKISKDGRFMPYLRQSRTHS